MRHSSIRLLATSGIIAIALPVSAATLPGSDAHRVRAVASPPPAAQTAPLMLSLGSTQAHDSELAVPSPPPVPSPKPTTVPAPADQETTAVPHEAPSPTAPRPVAAQTIEVEEPTQQPKPDRRPDPVEEPADGLSKVEARLLASLNAERRAAGLRELAPARDMVRIARDWSKVMAATGNFRHNPNLTAQLCCRSAFGENVAWGGVPDGWLMESTDGIHRNLMRSAGHRANILEPRFDQVGIGTVVTNGKLWVTQVFRRHS